VVVFRPKNNRILYPNPIEVPGVPAKTKQNHTLADNPLDLTDLSHIESPETIPTFWFNVD
jgi:hypothetical protein